MEKKFGLIIFIVILLLVIFGFMFFNQYHPENQIKVGNTIFGLPEGFHQGTNNTENDINITNGYDTLFFKECGDDNITKYINKYKKYIHDKNNNTTVVKINNFTVDNILIYKSTIVNDSSTIHYWFEYNNKTYSIYTWSGNNNYNNIVKDIVKTLN